MLAATDQLTSTTTYVPQQRSLALRQGKMTPIHSVKDIHLQYYTILNEPVDVQVETRETTSRNEACLDRFSLLYLYNSTIT